MSDANHRTTAQRHNDLVWPIVILGAVFIAALTIIIVTGHNTNDLIKAIAALGSTSATVLAGLSYLRAGQAAKQTNGDLDDRMRTAVSDGIAEGIKAARVQAAAAAVVPGRRPRKPTPHAPDDGNHPDVAV